MTRNLRTVLVTGAAHGIGAATARRFAAQGDHVLIADIDDEAAGATASAILASGGSAEAIHLDVGQTDSWNVARAFCDDLGLQVAVLVNNAFVIAIAPAHELAEADWDRQLSVNVGSVYRSIRTFHDMLSTQRGSIVNVSSVHALAAWRGHPAYASAKGAMLSLTRQLALEYGPEIRVNAVLPGAIETRQWDPYGEDARREQDTHIVLGRLGQPEEVAAAIAFLASADASYITATTILVDGGLMATV